MYNLLVHQTIRNITYNQKRSMELQLTNIQKNNQESNQERFKPVERLLNSLEKALLSKGAYYADCLYKFEHLSKIQGGLKLNPTKNYKKVYWLVLGREHYYETSKEYPIANQRDLKKALQYEDSHAPFEGSTLRYIERINEQTHRVTFWVFKESVLDITDARPWLVLPESFLLSKAFNGKACLSEIECINKTLFISKTGQALKSGIKSPQTATIESFAFSTGSSVNIDVQYCSPQEFTSLLYQNVKSLNWLELQSFFLKRKQVNWKRYPWKSASIITVVVLSSYLALSSAWLLFDSYRIKQELSSKRIQVDEALLVKQQYSKQKELYKALSKPLTHQVPYWNVWPVIIDTISEGSEIRTFKYNRDQITISGSTNEQTKATDILESLTQNPYVVSPTFKSSIRKYRDKESFKIGFMLADTPKTIVEQSKTLQQEVPNATTK